MITVSEAELDAFVAQCETKTIKRKSLVTEPGQQSNEVYFISKGLLRVTITDKAGTEHTLHFALEGQFIADYTAFIQQQPSSYDLQALEDLELMVLPRAAINWGYANMQQGEKLGRLIAEYYFMYQDNRLNNMYFRSPKERYDTITEVFPNIHNRVPQHMIASYLGITPIHLSRLKRSNSKT